MTGLPSSVCVMITLTWKSDLSKTFLESIGLAINEILVGSIIVIKATLR